MATQYLLEKSLWTENDFESMGWHDSTIHAMAFLHTSFEIALDLDYIFSWVKPRGDGEPYQFWISPTTLVFENIYDLVLDLEGDGELQLDSIVREDPRRPRNAEAIGRDTEWNWRLLCQQGELHFRSVGYKMYV